MDDTNKENNYIEKTEYNITKINVDESDQPKKSYSSISFKQNIHNQNVS